jgi:hypothetical protein
MEVDSLPDARRRRDFVSLFLLARFALDESAHRALRARLR